MYRNVLVPLDRSVESEGVLDVIPQLIDPDDGQAILLTVIPPGRTRNIGDLVVLGSQQEEEDRARAMFHLNRIVERLREASVKASAAVVVNQSVATLSLPTASSRKSISSPCTPMTARDWPA